MTDQSELRLQRIGLIEAAAKAHRRMEVTQTMRKLRRFRAGGAESPGPA